MNEKLAVADLLTSINSSISQLMYSIEQGNNENFRNTLADHRNKLEALQFELYKIGKQKGYYVPAAKASQNDIDQVKNELAC